jgi:hypothetical protein
VIATASIVGINDSFAALITSVTTLLGVVLTHRQGRKTQDIATTKTDALQARLDSAVKVIADSDKRF